MLNRRYVAEHPNPNEPLGFEGARFNPGPAVDPGLNSGVLIDEPSEELFYDETDPDAPAARQLRRMAQPWLLVCRAERRVHDSQREREKRDPAGD